MTGSPATVTPGLADTLKSRTAAAHRDAESHRLQRGLFDGSTTPGEARRFFEGLLKEIVCLETAARRAGSTTDAAFVEEVMRGHAERLRADLIESPEAEPDSPSIPHEPSLPAIIGGAYVIEGSMNGNRYLVTAASRRDGHGLPLRYLGSYGDAQPARWADFRRWLDQLPWNDDAREACVQAAERMFGTFTRLSDHALASSSS